MIVSICKGDVAAPEGVSEKKLMRYCKKVAVQTDDSITGGRLVDAPVEAVESDLGELKELKKTPAEETSTEETPAEETSAAEA